GRNRALGHLDPPRPRGRAHRLHRGRWGAARRQLPVSRRKPNRQSIERGGETPMEHTATQERAARAFEQSAMLGDTTATYLEINQRLIGDLTELSVGTAKENARLVAELQMATIDALHESQAAVLPSARWGSSSGWSSASCWKSCFTDVAERRNSATPPVSCARLPIRTTRIRS